MTASVVDINTDGIELGVGVGVAEAANQQPHPYYTRLFTGLDYVSNGSRETYTYFNTGVQHAYTLVVNGVTYSRDSVVGGCQFLNLAINNPQEAADRIREMMTPAYRAYMAGFLSFATFSILLVTSFTICTASSFVKHETGDVIYIQSYGPNFLGHHTMVNPYIIWRPGLNLNITRDDTSFAYVWLSTTNIVSSHNCQLYLYDYGTNAKLKHCDEDWEIEKQNPFIWLWQSHFTLKTKTHPKVNATATTHISGTNEYTADIASHYNCTTHEELLRDGSPEHEEFLREMNLESFRAANSRSSFFYHQLNVTTTQVNCSPLKMNDEIKLN